MKETRGGERKEDGVRDEGGGRREDRREIEREREREREK